jgi:hypothetical protein
MSSRSIVRGRLRLRLTVRLRVRAWARARVNDDNDENWCVGIVYGCSTGESSPKPWPPSSCRRAACRARRRTQARSRHQRGG